MEHLNGIPAYLLRRSGSAPRHGLWIAVILLAVSVATGQRMSAPAAIEALRQGTLILRIPSYRAKIDTLNAMMQRETDPNQRKRLEKMQVDAQVEQDRISREYREAMAEAYRFSHAGYIMDYEAGQPEEAMVRFFGTTGDSLVPWHQVDPDTRFMLQFERTAESKIDALVIHAPDGGIPPAPFPATFSLGGFNLFWMRLMGQDHATWRIETLNRKLFGYLQQVRERRD